MWRSVPVRRTEQNMAFPPLSWQTYDITFWSPRFDALGNKTQDARLTVLHNGVIVHNQIRVERKQRGTSGAPELLPTKLQDHGNPVQFRNIWLVEHSTARDRRQRSAGKVARGDARTRREGRQTLRD